MLDMSTLTMPRSTAVQPLDKVRAIEDPEARLAAAAKLVRKAEERADAARGMRDMAAAVAHLDHGVAPVTLYRDVLDCSRGLFVRIIQRAPAKRPSIPNAVEAAGDAAKAVKRHEDTIEQARLIRDETALLLMNGGVDPVSGQKVTPVSNADIARLTGLTTARVAQVRTGTR